MCGREDTQEDCVVWSTSSHTDLEYLLSDALGCFEAEEWIKWLQCPQYLRSVCICYVCHSCFMIMSLYRTSKPIFMMC